MCAALLNPFLLIPRPEMATIPEGPFLMGDQHVGTCVPEFQIGKYEVTNEEFDPYVTVYKKTPYALLGTKGPYADVLVAWGHKGRVIRIQEKDRSLFKTGRMLMEEVLRTSRHLSVPPILAPNFELQHPAYVAYAVFSDWAQSQCEDPFSLLFRFMKESEETNGCFQVVRVVPDPEERKKQLRGDRFGGDRAPAVFVDWYEAYGYARAVGMRLPTDEEWEKAARGPEGFEYGTASGNLIRWQAHYGGEVLGVYSMAHVGSYPPNGYGLYDMTGNVWEWTMWHPAEKYPCGLRGGSWLSTHPNVLRAAHRILNRPISPGVDRGFRVAR